MLLPDIHFSTTLSVKIKKNASCTDMILANLDNPITVESHLYGKWREACTDCHLVLCLQSTLITQLLFISLLWVTLKTKSLSISTNTIMFLLWHCHALITYSNDHIQVLYPTWLWAFCSKIIFQKKKSIRVPLMKSHPTYHLPVLPQKKKS